MNAEAAQVLHEAAGHVEKGWVRRRLTGQFGTVCALGAIEKAMAQRSGDYLRIRQNPSYLEVITLLAQVMREQYGDVAATSALMDGWAAGSKEAACIRYENVITHVNDDVAKNRKEIIAAMEKAAARAES